MARATQDNDELLTERLILPVTKSMAAEIKRYWHEHQLDSRAEAMRTLIQIGLDSDKKRKR